MRTPEALVIVGGAKSIPMSQNTAQLYEGCVLIEATREGARRSRNLILQVRIVGKEIRR